MGGDMTQLGDEMMEALDTHESGIGVADASQHEERARKTMILYLFKLFDVADIARARMYVEQTREIPLDKLRLALRMLVRRYHWPRLPQVGDIWLCAKEASGMHRQQYRAGRYLPAPQEWPPEGLRHGIQAGTHERINPNVIALPMVAERLQIAAGRTVTDEQAGCFD